MPMAALVCGEVNAWKQAQRQRREVVRVGNAASDAAFFGSSALSRNYSIKNRRERRKQSLETEIPACGMRLTKSLVGERRPSWKSTFLTRFKASVPSVGSCS